MSKNPEASRLPLSPEAEKELAEFMTNLFSLATKESTFCPYHKAKGEEVKVESMEKVGRSVYLRPCGCRFWAGDIPEAWRTPK